MEWLSVGWSPKFQGMAEISMMADLRYLFEKLPFSLSEDNYRALLPYNLSRTDLALGHTASGV